MGDSGAVSLHCVSCRAQHAEPGWLYAPTKNLFMKFAPSLKTYSTTWVVTFSCYTFGTCSWSSRKRKMALTRQSESSGRFSNVRKDKDAPSSSTCHHSAPTSSFLTLLFSYFSSPPSPPSSITTLLHHHPPQATMNTLELIASLLLSISAIIHLLSMIILQVRTIRNNQPTETEMV